MLLQCQSPVVVKHRCSLIRLGHLKYRVSDWRNAGSWCSVAQQSNIYLWGWVVSDISLPLARRALLIYPLG